MNQDYQTLPLQYCPQATEFAVPPIAASLAPDHSDQVSHALNRDTYLVKEHVGLFKASSNYDVYDPETGELVLLCREPHLSFLAKLARFTDYRRMMPFDVHLLTPDGQLLLHVQRGFSLFLSHVSVIDAAGRLVGGFKQKLFSIGGGFSVLDASGQPVCQLKGKWTGWEFRFTAGDRELARVTKKWTGLSKELFTSADSYVLQVSPHAPPSSDIRMLILAAVMCVDLVLKE